MTYNFLETIEYGRIDYDNKRLYCLLLKGSRKKRSFEWRYLDTGCPGGYFLYLALQSKTSFLENFYKNL